MLITISGAILCEPLMFPCHSQCADAETARINARTSNGVIYGLEIVLGTGTGAFSQAGFAIAQAMVQPAEIQSAISFMLIGTSSWL